MTIIFVFVIAIPALFIIFISPKTKKIASNQWFWIIVGFIGFGYAFFGRQLQYLVPELRGKILYDLFDSPLMPPPDPNRPLEGLDYSRLLLLDLCPFYIIFGSLSLFLKKKKIAQILAPFGFYGAAITLFGQIIHDVGNPVNYPRGIWIYIFVGYRGGELYFMIHYLSMLISLMVICWTTNWKKTILIHMHGFALFYFSYILIMVALIPKIMGNTTGVLEADWQQDGEYSRVEQILKIKWPAVMIVGYIISYIVIAIVSLTRIGIEIWARSWRSKVHLRLLQLDWYKNLSAKWYKFKCKKS